MNRELSVLELQNWTFKEIAILGADQRERGLWGRECPEDLLIGLLISDSCETVTGTRMPN